MARHPRGERGDALRVLGRVVVAVLGGEREPAQRVDADLLGVAERRQDLAGDDRLELAEPARHLAVLEHEPHPPHARRDRATCAVRREVRDGHHGRRRAEPERVQPQAHGLGVDVAEAEHDLGLRGRRLGRHELQRGHQIDRRAARRAQLCTKGLGILAVPADNQDTGAGEDVVIHTET